MKNSYTFIDLICTDLIDDKPYKMDKHGTQMIDLDRDNHINFIGGTLHRKQKTTFIPF